MSGALGQAAGLFAAETEHASGSPPIVWGLGVLVVFLILLGITLAFGKGRT